MPVRAARAAYPASLAITRVNGSRPGVVLEEEVDGSGRLAGELLGPAAVPVGAGWPPQVAAQRRSPHQHSSACRPPLARAAAASAYILLAPVSWARRVDRAIAMDRSRR